MSENGEPKKGARGLCASQDFLELFHSFRPAAPARNGEWDEWHETHEQTILSPVQF